MNDTLIVSAPSITWLLVTMKPVLSMMKPVPAPMVSESGCCRRPRGPGCPGGCGAPPPPKKRRSRSSPPPKNCVRSCVRWRDSVRMFTTVGICALAMLRKVEASIGPPSGLLFIGGMVATWADDAGVRSRRDAITIPTATDATEMRTA
jgi:hypothetical protein